MLPTLAPIAVLALALPVAAQAPSPGFTLFNPNFDTNAYLVDSAGQTVHTWAFAQRPGNTVYLEPDGVLVRAKQVPGPIGIGGFGGGVQRAAFDGTLLWDFTVSDAQFIQHHDVLPLPNGNVLMIVWERMGAADAIAAGRDPSLLGGSDWLPDALLEYRQVGPAAGVEVWRWRAMDHLIQDFDATKPNFGVVADHPERIDINFPPTSLPNGEWMHANSIGYDPDLDQVLISVPFLNELWIIDHSTTTAEAAGSTGGNSGKGGDLLYRWGNPAAYDRGTALDQQLFNQHGAKFNAAGNLMVFNNQVPGPPLHSEAWELARQADGAGDYPLAPGAAFGPAGPMWSYAAPNPAAFFSGFLSSALRLSNGNTLITSGTQARLFEVTDAGQVVFDYVNTLPVGGNPWVFRSERVEHWLWSDSPTLSAAAGGTVGFDLVAGSPLAGHFHLLLGSASGTAPGFPIDGQTLPLAIPDPYFTLTLTQPNVAPFSQTFGVLDGLGKASASIAVAPGALGGVVGVDLDHAFVAIDPVALTVALASNAQRVTIVP